MLLHRKANKWESKCNNIPVDKAINMTKMSSHLVRLEAAPCVQVKSKFIPFLLDSGSDANILSYNSFTSIGFRTKFLDNSTKYNIKSSQGYQEDVILGTFTTKLVLKDTEGVPMLTNLMEFMVTKSHYYLKENILGTPFFEQCKLSLSWESGIPNVKGTFYKNNVNDSDPCETNLQILENPRITNINVIKLHPQTTTLIDINIGPSNINYDNMTLNINHNEAEEFLCTELNTKIMGNNLAMGNIWENELLKPTLVNGKELYMQAHITNKSDDMIELAEGTMDIQHEMKPTINKVLINANFLVNSITTINQEEILEPGLPTHREPHKNSNLPKNDDGVTTTCLNSSVHEAKEAYNMVRTFNNSLTGDTTLPFTCPYLQPITGRKDSDLSRHISMMYNPTSANTYEANEWPETPETDIEVDWNIFILETRNKYADQDGNNHHQSNDLLINSTRTEQTQGTNRKQTHDILNSNEGEVIDLPDYTDEHLESRWMKSNLAMDYCDNTDDAKGDKLKSDVLNEFQSPKVGHLSKNKQKQYKLIFQTFRDVLAKDKHAVGDFKPFKVKLPTDPDISCYQKQRNMIL